MDGMDSIKAEEGLKKILSRDMMSRFAITVKAEESLLKAAHLMTRFKISGLPVVSVTGKIVGIVTSTDLFRVIKESLQDKKQPGVKRYLVSAIMSQNVFTVKEDTTLFDIISVVNARNIHTLPVLRGDEIIGVIGRRDILYAYYNLVHEAGEE